MSLENLVTAFVAATLSLAGGYGLYLLKLLRPFADRLWQQRQLRYSDWLYTFHEFLHYSNQRRWSSAAGTQWTKADNDRWKELFHKCTAIQFEAATLASAALARNCEIFIREAIMLSNRCGDFDHEERTRVEKLGDLFNVIVNDARTELGVDRIDSRFGRELRMSDRLFVPFEQNANA
jgi:hypothetical protein